MTREDAIHFANCLKNNYTIDLNDMQAFCDETIKALEQEPTTKNDLGVDWDELKRKIFMEVDGGTDGNWLRYGDVCDNIRAEIMQLDIFYDSDHFSSNKDAMFKCNDILQILDKCEGEVRIRNE